MKIYIAGKMSGIKNYNEEQFNQVEKYLKTLGFEEIVNPIKISKQVSKELNKNIEDIKKEVFMKYDIKELVNCDVIALLPNWMNSTGASLEFMIARALNLKVIFLREDEFNDIR